MDIINQTNKKIGIQEISFYSPKSFLSAEEFAKNRNIESEKLTKGLGILSFSVLPPHESVITMAKEAALPITKKHRDIDMVIFATESSVDQSRAAALYLKDSLELKNNCKFIEYKQACYSSSFALFSAIAFIKASMHKKILVIAADNARYGLNTQGEATQGCGACAFLVSENPQIVEFETVTGVYSEFANDFYRPNFQDFAVVNGKLSMEVYLNALEMCFYDLSSKIDINCDIFLCHTPFPKMAQKAFNKLKTIANNKIQFYESAITLSRKIGNCYTASIFLSLFSLLTHEEDLVSKTILFYSYGSGATSEMYIGKIMSNYKSHLYCHKNIKEEDSFISFSNYEMFYNSHSIKEPVNM
jgi:hydroxymethylglutaryl-CoA synthase